MKLISLNTWGGILKTELHDFIKKHADNTDIFCFQEVFNNAVNARKFLGNVDINLYSTLTKLLPAHKGYYAPVQHDDEGLAIFVKPEILLNEAGDVFVYSYLNSMKNADSATLGRNIQFIQFTKFDKDYTVINFHGLWSKNGKKDSPNRLEQSRRIKEFIQNRAKGKIILVGDFNLEPNTSSLLMLEEHMINLIKEFKITSTRSHHYKKPIKFADYTFVSKDVEVAKFEVLQDPVSDHLPMLIEFS